MCEYMCICWHLRVISCSLLLCRFKQLNPEQKAEMSSFFVGNVFDIDVERNILYDR